jgi:hypothetical protein
MEAAKINLEFSGCLTALKKVNNLYRETIVRKSKNYEKNNLSLSLV